MEWEDWREGDDVLTSGWMRATSPSGDATFEGAVGWSGELGYGVREPEPEQSVRDASRRDDATVTVAKRSKVVETVSDATFLEYVVFFSAAVMILGGAIGVIALRNPVHAALGLVLTLFGVAVQFVALGAHFVAVVQIIVYAGAIVVLFLFVIMLLGIDSATDLSIEPIKLQRPLAAVMGARPRRPARRGDRPGARRARHQPRHRARIRRPARAPRTTPTSNSSRRASTATTCSPWSSPRCC